MAFLCASQALHEGRVTQADLFFGSVRRFSAFGLLQISPIERWRSDENDEGIWYECTCLKEPDFELKIRRIRWDDDTDIGDLVGRFDVVISADWTFQHFVELAQSRFYVEILMAYDTCVWELHARYQQERPDIYDANLHYPQMLILRKILST
ncbi:hypothetical protein HPB48_014544 [Haemaphysalis longicornis]|uniref:Uncharacterized protein n=1 Tax=Haemaphysalis longicornis TaxID=44386 RepID=A0A9J6H000_HAELO|nr:hypothetical protein HPB48_014544 [Haemaphysalis longicornis]